MMRARRPTPTHLAAALLAAALAATTMLPLIATTAAGRAGADPARPEAATGLGRQVLATARQEMVAAAHPLAVDAGLEILAAGGSAIDAAVAVQAVLGLVEPQSSGLGGGAFLLHWAPSSAELKTYDGRETAPMAARPDRFMSGGKPLPFKAAVASGLSIGVPGVVRLLEDAHRNHGTLAWARLFEPAIRIAEQGFIVSPRLAGLLAAERPEQFGAAARAYFFDTAGRPWPAGHRLINHDYARTLREIAAGGASAFYGGRIAAAIVEAARNAHATPGDLTLADLAGYRIVERPPVCTDYRGFRICGMGPPSSGAITVAQTLALIEPLPIGSGPNAAMAPLPLHAIAEAEKLAYADRDRYIADPGFVTIPSGLMDQAYLSERRTRITLDAAMPPPPPGSPPSRLGRLLVPGEDATVEQPGTSHVSIVDGRGNAVSMTTTIENAFGARAMAAGMLLNNQLTDFSFRPTDSQGRPVANAVAPGKRPRSSMAPTLVFSPNGRLRFVLGSPGGSRIIQYVVKLLVAMIDWQLDPQAAAALANFGSRGSGFEMEHDGAPWYTWRHVSAIAQSTDRAIRMRGFGHPIHLVEMTSGANVIAIGPSVLTGGSDPRREGIARGR